MREKKSNTLAIVIVIILVLLSMCCCCAIVNFYLESETGFWTNMFASLPLPAEIG